MKKMKSKYQLARLNKFTFVIIFLMASAHSNAQLFELKINDAVRGYLFGSTHGPLAGVPVNKSIVINPILISKIVVLETANGLTQAEKQSQLALTSATSVFDMLSKQGAACARDAMNEVNGDILKSSINLRPILFALAFLGNTIEKFSPSTSAFGYDFVVADAGRNFQKLIASIETSREKISILNKFDDTDAVNIIEKLCLVRQDKNEAEKFKRLHSSSIESYTLNDIEGIFAAQRNLYVYLGVSESFIDLFWTDRNKIMAIKIEGLLNNNRKPFVAIGASHLGGNYGVVNILRNKGITVRQIVY